MKRALRWIAFGIALAVILRAPWFGAALGRDEGGLALIADTWHGHGPFAYGNYFLDRPPLLVELFRLADGPTGIRILGALAAGSAVAITTLIGRLVGASLAVTATVAAVLVSSASLGSVFTPAELIAIVPSSASVLLLVAGIARPRGGYALFAGAGVLAVLALLVKQSFGDAALAAGAALVALAWLRRPVAWRALAWAGGALATIAALDVWERLGHFPDGSVAYAVLGFRLDAVHSLAGRQTAMRLERLPLPALASGVALALVLAAVAIARTSDRPVLRALLAAWLAGGLAGLALGGSYWPHYMVELAPVAAVGSGLFAAQRPRHRRLALAGIVAPALCVLVVAVIAGAPQRYQRDAVTVASYLRNRAAPRETAYVLYARTNVLYYSGLRSPYPYNWSLMVRAVPGAEARLRALLASPRRPTWIIEWQSERAFGLDTDGATRRLVAAGYRRVGVVCGHPVFLARGATARPLPPDWHDCRPDLTAN